MPLFIGFANIKLERCSFDDWIETYPKYTCWNEVAPSGKEHIHFCIETEYKLDTVRKQLLKYVPLLKWKGHGGERNYRLRDYATYKDEPYPEYSQDYMTKDRKHRSGDLWHSVDTFHSKTMFPQKDSPIIEWEARWIRYTEYHDKLKVERNTKKKKKDDKNKDEKLAEALEVLLEEDKSRIDRRKLTQFIIDYYSKNGKPSNRNIFRVIAEQVIWYSHLVCPKDPKQMTNKDIHLAVDNEIKKMTEKND